VSLAVKQANTFESCNKPTIPPDVELDKLPLAHVEIFPVL
jgi:hypothetical protein